MGIQSKTNDLFISHPELSENEKKYVQDYLKRVFFQFERGFFDKEPWTKIKSKKTAPDNKNYQIDEARKNQLIQLILTEIINRIDFRKIYSSR